MSRKVKTVLSVLFMFLLFSTNPATSDEIHDAVKSGKLEEVKILLQGNQKLLNQKDQQGKTPLHHAVETGHTHIARYLIEQGADINLKDAYNGSVLHYAAFMGNLEIAELLLKKGTTSINEGDTDNMTPLHLACDRGHPEVVKLLLDHGADIEARDSMGRTPLMFTAGSRNMEVVHILIERGADINYSIAYQGRSYTLLTLAAMYGFKDLVDYLMDKKVDVAENMLEYTLQLAVQRNLPRLYDYVREKGLDIATIKERIPDLIHSAAASGSIEIMESLLDHGFDIAQKDKDGWTLLHYAVAGGQIEMMKYFLDKGVDKNSRNIKGETTFNLAEYYDREEAAAFLKEIGADTSPPRFPELKGLYMGQRPPGDKPEMFMPGIVSGHYRAHSPIVFSPDGKEACWSEMQPGRQGVVKMEMKGNRWTPPQNTNMWADPSFSPDGRKLYFISHLGSSEGEGSGKDIIVFRERTASGWSEPKPVGEAVNSINLHWKPSVDNKGNLYFSEFADNMYFSQYKDGEYKEPVNIKKHFKNETLTGCNPYISPAGDYLLFSADGGILYITFKKKDGSWTDRIHMGDEINAAHCHVNNAEVTPDGKYIFFVSAGPERTWGIYWVSSKIIAELKRKHLGS